MNDLNSVKSILETKRTVCAIVKFGNKICLVKNDLSNDEELWTFPSIEIKQSEIVIQVLTNYIKKTYNINVKSNDVNYFCNIKHKCESFYMDIDSFIIDLDIKKVDDSLFDEKNWFEIDELFNIPLASEAITLAQVLLEY